MQNSVELLVKDATDLEFLLDFLFNSIDGHFFFLTNLVSKFPHPRSSGLIL